MNSLYILGINELLRNACSHKHEMPPLGQFGRHLPHCPLNEINAQRSPEENNHMQSRLTDKYGLAIA